jgi:hypothetical protein
MVRICGFEAWVHGEPDADTVWKKRHIQRSVGREPYQYPSYLRTCAAASGPCSLATAFAAGGEVQLTLHFTSTKNLFSNAGAELAYISTGSVQPATLPEPTFLALLGSGLLGLAGLGRFKSSQNCA